MPIENHGGSYRTSHSGRRRCNCLWSGGSIKAEWHEMKRAELLMTLNDYVEGTVDPSICEEFEQL